MQTGLFELPVMLDPPSAEIRQHSTELAPSGTKWVDSKKTIFSVEILSATTVHPLDPFIDQVGNGSNYLFPKLFKLISLFGCAILVNLGITHFLCHFFEWFLLN